MNKGRRGSVTKIDSDDESDDEDEKNELKLYYNANENGDSELNDEHVTLYNDDVYISNDLLRNLKDDDIEEDIDNESINQTIKMKNIDVSVLKDSDADSDYDNGNVSVLKDSDDDSDYDNGNISVLKDSDDDSDDDNGNISVLKDSDADSDYDNGNISVLKDSDADSDDDNGNISVLKDSDDDSDDGSDNILSPQSASILIDMETKEKLDLKELALALAEEEENSELSKLQDEFTTAKYNKKYERENIIQHAIIEAGNNCLINDINSENNIEENIDLNVQQSISTITNINKNLIIKPLSSFSTLFDNAVTESNKIISNNSSPDLSFNSRKKSISPPHVSQLQSKYELTLEIDKIGNTLTQNYSTQNTSILNTSSASNPVLNILIPVDKFNNDVISNLNLYDKSIESNKHIPKIEIDLQMNYSEKTNNIPLPVIEIDLQSAYFANNVEGCKEDVKQIFSNSKSNFSEFDLIYERNIAKEGIIEPYKLLKSPSKQSSSRNKSISPTSPSRYRSISPTINLNRSRSLSPNKIPLRSSTPILNDNACQFNATNNNQSLIPNESNKPPFVIPKHQSPKPKFIDSFNNESYLIWLEQQQRNIGSTIMERKLRKDVLTNFMNCDKSRNNILEREEFDNFIISMGILPSPKDGLISINDNIFQKTFVFASVLSVKYDSSNSAYNTNELITMDNNDIQEIFASGINILGAIEFTEIIYGIGSGSQKENIDLLNKDSKELISQIKLWKIRTPIIKTVSKVEENKVSITNNFVLPPNSKIDPVIPNQNLEETLANRKKILNERISNLFKKTHPFKPPSQIPREGDIVQVNLGSQITINATVISVLKDGINMNVRSNLNEKILTKIPISSISKWIERANHYQNKAFSNLKKIEKDNRSSEEKKMENCTFQPKLYGPSPFVSERTMREREENIRDNTNNTRWKNLPNKNKKVVVSEDIISEKKSFRKTNIDLLNGGILINNNSKQNVKKKKKQKRRKTIVGKLCGYYIPGLGLMRGPPTNAGVPLYMMDPISPPSFDDGYYITTNKSNSTTNKSIASFNSISSTRMVTSKGYPFAPPLPNWAWLTGGDPKSNVVKASAAVKIVITKKVKTEEKKEAPQATGWGAVLEEMNRKKEAKNGGVTLKKVVKEVLTKAKVGSLKHTKGSKKPVFTDIMDELAWKLASLRGDFDNDKEEAKQEIEEVNEEKVIQNVVKCEVNSKVIEDGILDSSEVKTSHDSKEEITDQNINKTSSSIEIVKEDIVANIESKEEKEVEVVKKVVEVVEKVVEVVEKVVVVIAEPEVKKPALSLANLFNKKKEVDGIVSIPKVAEIVSTIAVPKATKIPAPPPLPIDLSSPPYIFSDTDITTSNTTTNNNSDTIIDTIKSINTTISTSPGDKADLLPGYYLAHPNPGSIGNGEILPAGVTTLELCKIITDELAKDGDDINNNNSNDDDDDDDDDQDMINSIVSPSKSPLKSPGSSPDNKSSIPKRSNSIANNNFMLMVDESKLHKINLKLENDKKKNQDYKRLEKLKIIEIQHQERLRLEEEYKQSLIKDATFFSSNIIESNNNVEEKVFHYPKALPKCAKVEPENYDYRKDLYAKGEIVISDLPLPPNFHDSIQRMKLGVEMRQKKKDLMFHDSLRSYSITDSPQTGPKDSKPATKPIEFISHVDKRNEMKITTRKLVGQAGLYVEETPVIPTFILKNHPTKENSNVKILKKTTPLIAPNNNDNSLSLISNRQPEKKNEGFEIHPYQSSGPIDHHPQQKRPPSFFSSLNNLTEPQSPALISGIASRNRIARAAEKKLQEELALQEQKNQNTARKERLRLLANKTAKAVGAYVPQSNRKNCHEKLVEKYSKLEDKNNLSISSISNVKKDYYNLMGSSNNQYNYMYNSNNLNSMNKNNYHSPQSDYLNYPNNQNTPYSLNVNEKLSIEEFEFFSDGPKEYNF